MSGSVIQSIRPMQRADAIGAEKHHGLLDGVLVRPSVLAFVVAEVAERNVCRSPSMTKLWFDPYDGGYYEANIG